MKIRDIIAEKYTSDNSHLHRYLKGGDQFDHYDQWWLVCQWVEENGLLDDVSDILGEPIESEDELNEHDPDIYDKFPDEWKPEIAGYVTDWLAQHAPAELPSTHFFSVSDKKLLPANTWLVHFSDNADNIAQTGFTRGMYDMTKLGLTTYYNDSVKGIGGYNFAFIATSRYADQAASDHKYGKHAVMFQNSGVRAYHSGDEEEQIIFHGKDVNPGMIILLEDQGDGWAVMSRKRTRRGDYILFQGDFDACVTWVIQHYQTYRKKLFSR